MIYTTPAEFEDQMRNIYTSPDGDVEMNHIRADELMCEVLKQNGYEKGVEIFEDQMKWYA